MTEKWKQVLTSEEATIIWRLAITLLIMLSCWTFQRQVDRIDSHDNKINEIQSFILSEFVKKDELCELKADVKAIQKTLNTTMPEISRFMGQTAEYMRTDGGRK